MENSVNYNKGCGSLGNERIHIVIGIYHNHSINYVQLKCVILCVYKRNIRILTDNSWATYLFRYLDPGRRATLPNIQNARSGGGLAHISTDRDRGCPAKPIIVLFVG